MHKISKPIFKGHVPNIMSVLMSLSCCFFFVCLFVFLSYIAIMLFLLLLLLSNCDLTFLHFGTPLSIWEIFFGKFYYWQNWENWICSFFPCPMKFICISNKKSIVLLWSSVINKRCITLETAKVLKILILLCKVNCLIPNNFKIFSILTKCLHKLSWLHNIFIIQKITWFYGFECHLNTIQNTNTLNFTVCFIRF